MATFYVSDKNAIMRSGAPDYKALNGNPVIPAGTAVSITSTVTGSKYVLVKYGNTETWTSINNLTEEKIINDLVEYWFPQKTAFSTSPFADNNAAFDEGSVVKRQKVCGVYSYLFDEVKKIGGWLLTPAAFFKAPKDRAKNFAWLQKVSAWTNSAKLLAADLNQVEANRNSINDRTDKSTYIKTMFYTNTSLKGYVYAGKDVKQAQLSGAGKKKMEVTNLLIEEILHEGGYSAINAYDAEIVTWGKGFAYTGQLPNVFDKLMKKNTLYREVFQRVGLDYAANTLYAVKPDGTVLKAKAAAEYLRADKRLLNFLIEFAEKEEYALDVANAQMETLMEGTMKVPDYIIDEVNNKYRDNWTDQSVSLLCHLTHWLPAGGWRINNFSSSKGDIKMVMYQFIANIFKNGIHQAKYENGVKSWKEGFDWLNNAMKNFGQPKGNARKVFDTTWNVALTKELEFRKEAGKTLNTVFIKGTNEKLKNVFIMKDGNQYRILVPPGDVLSNYITK